MELPPYQCLSFRLYFSDDASKPPNALRIETSCPFTGVSDELAESISSAEELAGVQGLLARTALLHRICYAGGK